jgi:CDP-paratose 2-epimerase
MKVIITGAAGFIGSHAAERFLKRGDTVVGIDNLSRPGNTANLQYLQGIGQGRFHFHHGDIRSATDIDRIFARHADAGAVIHEAGQVAVTTSVAHPRMDFESNALGTLNVLEATRAHAPRSAFLFASTNKVYGGLEHVRVQEAARRYEYADIPAGVDESEPVDFHSPYGCSKGAAEQYVRDYHRIYGLKTVAFRQSCIYGTRQYGMEDQGWVAWFTIAALLGRSITVYGDGKQVRDVLWVEDLVDLYLRAIERIDVAAGRIYNAGGGASNSLSLLELLTMLEEQLGHPIPYKQSGWRPGDQRIFIANSGKARRELGWEPSTAPVLGLPALVEWTRVNAAQIEPLLPAALAQPAGAAR